MCVLHGVPASTSSTAWQQRACLRHPGQGHLAAAQGGMCMMTYLLCCEASPRIVTCEEDRLRALQHVCAALPRTAQALAEQVRRLSSASADGPAASVG